MPKVVGGYTPACLERAVALYSQAVDTVVPVSSCRVAEATKLLENIFRSVNIALVNELKLVYEAMGIDIWEVIEAAKTKPFGFMPFYPGPGLGGHCIPIDPFYLTWKAREYGRNTRFIELAGEINTSMPEHVVHRVAEALNSQRKPLNSSRILILGLAYKPNVDDERESPSYVLMDLLSATRRRGGISRSLRAVIKPTREHSHWAGKESALWTRESIRSFDVVLIATNHACINYQELADWAPLIVDTRNAMASARMKVGASVEGVRDRRTEDGGRMTAMTVSERILSFKDLRVYKLAFEVQQEVFEITRRFPAEERYALTDQLRRAARSIGANISEAWQKRWYVAHFVSKLTDADGEQAEVQHWLATAIACDYLAEKEQAVLLEKCARIGQMLGAMMADPEQMVPECQSRSQIKVKRTTEG